ncbi:MAG: gliding motility-associated C-terminal domain-containing protein [Bacteroidota bacterium]|nr:gliding motility-associated C-terminal domain-containing protein [Bacteroidota bacterium]
MKRKTIFSAAVLVITFNFQLLTLNCSAQFEVINKGILITNTGNTFAIKGNVIHQDNGSIANAGNFYITGDWTNNNPSGNVFTAGTNGWVYLDGATQTVSGNTITHFNNLELSGTGIKQLNNIDTQIEDTLSLNDREFATGDNTVFVIANGTGVVTQTTGFVSSTNDGGLSRNTLAANTYFFPVGSSIGNARFRPVDITPDDASPNTFKVRMANTDATSESFDRSLKEANIGEINPNFYHRINRTNGTSSADITLYYDNTLDGDYEIMAAWQNTAQWKNMGLVTTTNNYGLSGLTKQTVTDFSTTPVALAEVIPAILVANVFSPNNNGTNDVLHVLGKGIAEMQFTIFDRWGEKVFETTDVNTGWDGTYKGKPMNIGVFVYFIKGKFINGEIINKKGNVTLLR